eukprot:3426914-Ditylum_brightwellii.AAC.1
MIDNENRAVDYFKKGHDLQQESWSDDDTDLAETLIGLGDDYLHLQGKKEASTNAYYKAMKIYETNGVEQYDPRMTNLQNKLDVTDDKINPLQHTLSNEDEVEVRDE